MAGNMVVSDIAPEEQIAGIRHDLTNGPKRILIATHGAPRTQDGKVTAVEKTEMLIVSDQRTTGNGSASKHISSEECRGVIEI